MAFPPVESSVDFVALEERVLERWREHDVFAESLRRREGAPDWVFYEGPPTANGRPGLHHVWARSFKDLFPRFHTMRGRYVARKGGWDCHGLPVEVEVEKELGLSGKTQIRDFGIEEFNRRCRESVHRYVEEWSALTERMGMWLDTDDAYWTLNNDYIETVWWLIRQMWDKGLLYEGFKVVPYCGRCGTALSSHEVAQGYKDITEDSVYVRFPVVDREFDLLVWTTTPWTLISNVAAAVGPEVEYVQVRRPGGGRDVVLGRDRVEAVLGSADEAGWELVGSLRAADLAGLHYERPFDFVPIDEDANRVVVADFVTTADGSGIVHLAPAFGEVDREVGDAEGLPTLNPVDAAGRFEPVVEPFAGLFVKEADAGIIDALRAAGRLEKVEPYEHSYPHCWRCGTPLIYYAKTSWFARTQAEKSALLEQNESIAWHPEHIQHGRFGDWLENNVDWALSRDRYWGTPLPVWRCSGPTAHDTCIGSVAELAELSGRDLTELDLHRPYVDDVTFPCPVGDCGAVSDASRTRPRRLVRLRVDAGGAVPPSVRRIVVAGREERLRGPVPGRLHLRGDRPDERLVLLPSGGEHAGLRPVALPQRRLPGARRRPGRRQDVEVQGQRARPLGDLSDQGRRPAAVVLLLRRLAVDEPPGLQRGHRRVDPQVPPHLVEHAVVLRHLRQPGGLHAGGRRRRRRAQRPGPRPVAAVPPGGHRGRRHRRPRGLRHPGRRPASRGLRRRPLQLVCAAVSPPVLEGVRPRGLRRPPRGHCRRWR